MKVSGIICEYNPFHNGHLYHIRKTRENGATHIAAVMSGNFVQRGDTAIMDKLERARLAVRSGADLVIELPVQYSLASAENFASGAVHLLDSLGAVDELSFGSECGDTQKLLKAMETVDLAALTHADEIKSIMEKGYTYPRALNSVVNGYDPEAAAVIAEPNNTLAVEYLRALKRSGSAMEPFTVMREKAAHDGTEASDGFASASMLREMIENGESIDSFTTEEWAAAVRNAVKNGETASMSRLERVILYKLRTCSVEEIAQICDVGQGLEHRIYGARMAGSLDELLFTVKTKRYTMARIRRIMLALLIGITKTDMEQLPPYGRILAFNERGREILARAKGSAVIPFGSSIAKLSQLGDTAERFAELEIRASDIYGLALDTVTSAQKDYRAKIMIDME
ncbi:nucleotidyltransferase family protein [Ruminococcus sp.]|uniref:tRNA(Met) cytidine acetate ligase n=1 Tax=Ruminococcus sp. TaxID=41978 RepID=UPI0025F6E603|nr:nucleotidyltransferase family protein [Ruminococcus sp.]MBR1431305.1 nucleotidyltransferase family protein [Ruminococcus sp.]